MYDRLGPGIPRPEALPDQGARLIMTRLDWLHQVHLPGSPRSSANGKMKRSLAVFRRTQILAKERHYVALKTIREGAGMGTVIYLKAVG